jgi:hypothetical protein
LPVENKRPQKYVETVLDSLLNSFNDENLLTDLQIEAASKKLGEWDTSLNPSKPEPWKSDSALQDLYSWEFAHQPPLTVMFQLRQRHGNGRAVVAGTAVQPVPVIPPPSPVNDIGEMDQICIHCRARRFLDEAPGMFKFYS